MITDILHVICIYSLIIALCTWSLKHLEKIFHGFYWTITISDMKWRILSVLWADEQRAEVVLIRDDLTLNSEQVARAVRKTWKNFHLNTLLFSKNDHFSFQSLFFVYILKIRYLGNKGAKARILLTFFIPDWGLSIAKRWDLKGLIT
jgi:hypothetical protein